MRKHFGSLAIAPPELTFGRCVKPVRKKGISIGDGKVIPEIKFTLPTMEIEARNFADVEALYREMITGICRRAVELHQDQIVVEFELLPQMTSTPAWGETITRLLWEELESFQSDSGLQYLLRITPVDIRDSHKPPRRRESKELDLLLESFRRCALAGGDMLSIESTGGKEVTDPSIMAADLPGIIFGTAVLGSADMEFLWAHICEIVAETKTVPAGDTACGIGNTAMVLADQGYIPKVFSAVVRAVTTVRSLVAYEMGAVGPGKDCGYENAYIKAITGYPMSLEGKSAACAHFSSVGNITGAYVDLWSNESVQQVKLLSGMAPVVSMEQLIYDCRLFNAATSHGKALELRDWLVMSDAELDPQAFIFKPEIVAELASTIVSEKDDYQRGVRTAQETVALLEQGAKENALMISDRERQWLEKMKSTLSDLPLDPEQFLDEEKERWKEYVDYTQYGLAAVDT